MDLKKSLDSIRRPLEYAARSPAVAEAVRNLDVLVARQALALRKSEQGPGLQSSLNELTASLVGLEKLDTARRAERLQKALEILDRIYESLGLEHQRPTQAAVIAAESSEKAAEMEIVEGQAEPKGPFDDPVQFVKGVGPKVAQLLAGREIRTVRDIIYFLPRAYDDRRKVSRVSDLVPGRRATVVLRVLGAEARTRSKGHRMYKAEAADDSGAVTLAWFNVPPYIPQVVKEGAFLVVSGEPTRFRGGIEIHHPDIEPIDESSGPGPSLHFGRIVPIYSEIAGLPRKRLRRILDAALQKVEGKIADPLPDEIKMRLGLPDLGQALVQAHFPPEDDDPEDLVRMATPAYRRLIFDEVFSLCLGMALSRRDLQRRPGIAFDVSTSGPAKLRSHLPFKLTAAQERSLSEIFADLEKPVPMNRLVQGDVGSGKTVLASIAAATVIDNGYQAAMMAPTELLAEQHYRRISDDMGRLGFRTALLTGSVRGAERRRIMGELGRGVIKMLVGTHALIQEGVEFKKLGLVIIDEQHRFGVAQRAALAGKGALPDVLIMTATPIPRTLAMTLYGDLDISVLDEMPPGRTPIRTVVLSEKERGRAYGAVREEAAAGRQAYVVFPLVEASEGFDMADATASFERLGEKELKGLRLGLLHGRMRQHDKDQVMRRFVEGKIQALVSTTVIEVGIDVANATLIVIENAERFGLTQLHQLRGRVGRGTIPSRCLLVVGNDAGENAALRLKIMAETNDGFRISEEDLAIRGPGQFMGTRQTGMPDLRVADLARDIKLLARAREEAIRLVEADPNLSSPEHGPIAAALLERWAGKLELGRVG